MDLAQLKSMGAIVPRTLFRREITFQYFPLKPEDQWAESDVPEREAEKIDGSMTVFVRKSSSADGIELAGADERERPFVAIFRCICNEDGSPVFPTIEDAMSLELWLALPLWEAINSVNGVEQKKSQPGTSSGAKSRSPSAAGQSPNGKHPSRPRSIKKTGSMKKASGDSTAPNAAH